MKRVATLLGLTAGAVIFTLSGSTALAVSAHGQGGARFAGGASGGFSGGNPVGLHGGPVCGFNNFNTVGRCGSFGGYHTGYRRAYGCWGGSYGWNSYGNYGWAVGPSYVSGYYDSGPYADTSVVPVSYTSEPPVYAAPQPVVYDFTPPSQVADEQRASPTIIRGTTVQSNMQQVQSSSGPQYSPQKQLVGWRM